MKFLFRVFIFSIPIFLLTCKSSQRVTKSNLAYLYFNETTIIHPVYKVYHQNDDESTLYVRVNSAEILYSKNNPNKEFMGKMVMQVHIYEMQDHKLISSDTVFLVDKSGPAEGKYLLGEMQINLPRGSRYLAEITFDDIYRMQYVQDVVFIDKSDPYSMENYLIRNEDGEILFGNTFNPGSKLKVETNRNLPEKLKFFSYDPFDKLPPPPFVDQEDVNPIFSGESEFIVSTTEKNHFEIQLGEAGIYHLADDHEGSSAFTLLVFHSYYPYIKTVASMVRPMRFITTKQEYEKLVKSEDLKKDVDEFWFKVAGNAERASEVISEYYTRVEIANKYFTSFTQGWKTDRGLVYMIYGPPSAVYKTEKYEAWTYTEKTNIMQVEFNFHRVDNPYSNNHYVLDRSMGYKSSWYRAIDSWRQGRVF